MAVPLIRKAPSFVGGTLRIVGVLSILTCCACQRRDGASLSVASSLSRFSGLVYKELTEVSSGTVLFSPLSIAISLALAWRGAQGTTASQIAKVLALPAQGYLVELEFFKFMKQLKSPLNNATLFMANKLYVTRLAGLKPDYKRAISEAFLADCGELDFLHDKNGSKSEINTWIEGKTNGMIKSTITQLDTNTQLMTVDTLCLRSIWIHQFPLELSVPGTFQTDAHTSVDVHMMQTVGTFSFFDSKEHKLKIIQLPMQGHMSMIIVLPYVTESLSRVEAVMDAHGKSLLQGADDTPVWVKLPKFQIQATMEFSELFKKIAITDMFNASTANFAGLTDASVTMTRMVQKVLLEVTESGLGTDEKPGSNSVSSVRMDPITSEFFVDHPFLFGIRHDKSRTILLLGRLVSP